jgi:hypothetical protein
MVAVRTLRPRKTPRPKGRRRIAHERLELIKRLKIEGRSAWAGNVKVAWTAEEAVKITGGVIEALY